jgi:hypothetical protein
MSNIYYTSATGEAYCLAITTQNPDEIDSMLDQLNRCVITYITEAEFNALCPETMEAKVMDEDDVVQLGMLTFRRQELEDEFILK